MRSVTPAAMAWPPPFISSFSFTACRTALPRSTPEIERPEPVPMPPGSSAIANAGRANFSFSREATRPTTPGCQPSEAVTMTDALVLEPERSQRLGFGLRFRRLLDDAALGVEAIEFGGDPRGLGDIAFQQQPHARSARPMRPPALMRGPSMKPRCQASGGPFSRDTSISAVCPTWSRRRIAIRPLATNARLSPVSGATSATVPSAT